MNPWLVRHVIFPLHERLCRRASFSVYRDLLRTQWLSEQELRALQLRKLRTLVGTALRQTEYYSQFAGVDKDWLPETLDDLKKLPLLDRGLISQHREELTNRQVEGGPVRYRTGGSSGQPLIFYFDRRRMGYDVGLRWRAHEWWGIRPGEREAYVWNSPVELDRQDKIKHFRDWLVNDRIFPASTISRHTISDFVHQLRNFNPRCLFGYPSVMALMCSLAAEVHLRLDDLPVRAIFSTAEVLYEHQKKLISGAFGGVPVVNGYGSREAGLIACECPAGGMHINSENVIVETLRDGRPVGEDEDGEIVVTQLDCLAMPFIRYRTGDVGQLSGLKCSCGRGLELMKVIQGRSNDFLIAPDGRRIHSSAVHAALSGIPGIVRFQLLQSADGHVRIRLVTDKQFAQEGRDVLLKAVLQRLGPGGSASVEMCQEILPGASGKHRYIISELSALE